MGQSYIDDETMDAFTVFFQGNNEDDVKEQMASLEQRLKGKATLQDEAVGETLEEVRAKLREEFKKQFEKEENKP